MQWMQLEISSKFKGKKIELTEWSLCGHPALSECTVKIHEKGYWSVRTFASHAHTFASYTPGQSICTYSNSPSPKNTLTCTPTYPHTHIHSHSPTHTLSRCPHDSGRDGWRLQCVTSLTYQLFSHTQYMLCTSPDMTYLNNFHLQFIFAQLFYIGL